jgi:hypothetical protein
VDDEPLARSGSAGFCAPRSEHRQTGDRSFGREGVGDVSVRCRRARLRQHDVGRLEVAVDAISMPVRRSCSIGIGPRAMRSARFSPSRSSIPSRPHRAAQSPRGGSRSTWKIKSYDSREEGHDRCQRDRDRACFGAARDRDGEDRQEDDSQDAAVRIARDHVRNLAPRAHAIKNRIGSVSQLHCE